MPLSKNRINTFILNQKIILCVFYIFKLKLDIFSRTINFNIYVLIYISSCWVLNQKTKKLNQKNIYPKIIFHIINWLMKGTSTSTPNII